MYTGDRVKFLLRFLITVYETRTLAFVTGCMHEGCPQTKNYKFSKI